MAWQKPVINVIKPDIKNVSIYLRSTKKFGKSTLFRDVVLAKYGDPSRGLLIGCRNEVGYKMLDNCNVTQINTYKDACELLNWLIAKKGIEHNIELVAFDTGDEFALIADEETIRIANIENPNKKVKSIKAAMGGYTAGEKYSANDIIKPFMSKLMEAGFGVWVISHTKFKTIKEKGGLEEDGYMQLTSNMGADYEAAFGDIFDVTLTGVIDRDIEERGEGDKKKRYATDTVRKLYFRGTPLIDAGGRFAMGAVPEYLVFDQENMGKIFVDTIESGMEKSKLSKNSNVSVAASNKIKEPVDNQEEEDDTDISLDEPENNNGINVTTIRNLFKECDDKEIKKNVKAVISRYGSLDDADEEGLEEIYNLLTL